MDPDVLSTLLSDPSRVEGVPREELPEIAAAAERLRAVCWARLTALEAPTNGRAPELEAKSGDRLLTVKEVAQRTGLTRRQVYRRAASWPFARKVSERCLRFSEWGLERWLSRRGP